MTSNLFKHYKPKESWMINPAHSRSRTLTSNDLDMSNSKLSRSMSTQNVTPISDFTKLRAPKPEDIEASRIQDYLSQISTELQTQFDRDISGDGINLSKEHEAFALPTSDSHANETPTTTFMSETANSTNTFKKNPFDRFKRFH